MELVMERMTDPMLPPQRRPFTVLVTDLWRESAELIRGEAALARAELSEKAARLGAAIAWLAAGLAVCLAGVLLLLGALVAGIAMLLPEEHGPWLSPLIVGTVITLVGVFLLGRGRSELTTENLKPTQSARSVRKDVEVLKEHIQ
jgi:hypothetical protein